MEPGSSWLRGSGSGSASGIWMSMAATDSGTSTSVGACGAGLRNISAENIAKTKPMNAITPRKG